MSVRIVRLELAREPLFDVTQAEAFAPICMRLARPPSRTEPKRWPRGLEPRGPKNKARAACWRHTALGNGDAQGLITDKLKRLAAKLALGDRVTVMPTPSKGSWMNSGTLTVAPALLVTVSGLRQR